MLKNPTDFLSTGTALLDHDLVGSINAQGLQETVLGVVAAGEVGLGLGLSKDVAESKEGSSSSQQTLHSQTSGERPDIGGPDVKDIILLWDLESNSKRKVRPRSIFVLQGVDPSTRNNELIR